MQITDERRNGRLSGCICKYLRDLTVLLLKGVNMDFNLSKQQELIRQLMHDFAENEVKPLAAEIDYTEQFPVETVRKMAKYGMLGINIPAQYGGAGGDTLSYIIAIEELAKVCATTSIILSAHTSLACYPILAYGTEEQKNISFPLPRVKNSVRSV